MDTLEGNKLIAKFMGWDKSGYPETLLHTSWDWLMPVVEKISDIRVFKQQYELRVTIKKGFCLISYQDSMYEQTLVVKSINRKQGESTIEIVWLAVVEFIEWYNKEK